MRDTHPPINTSFTIRSTKSSWDQGATQEPLAKDEPYGLHRIVKVVITHILTGFARFPSPFAIDLTMGRMRRMSHLQMA